MEKQDSVQPYAAPVQIVHSAERKLPPTPMDEADFDVDKPSDAIKKPGGGSSASSASFSSKIALAIGASLLLIAVVVVAVLVTHKVDKDNHPIDHNPSVNPPPSNDKSNHKYHFVPPSDDGVVTNPKDVLGNISLKLVSFLPASGLIYNRQAITLVFSKSVIALGSNFDDATQVPPAKLVCNGKRPIPGKWRWVTTSIARFDPDIDWPNDLTCDVAVNQSLTSWDEQVLTPTKDGSRKYGTISLTGYVSTVTSKTASAATDGTWNPYLEKHLDDALECPSDGHIEFTFPQLVNAQYVAEKLAVKENIQTVAPNLKQFVLNGTCGTSRVGVDGITYTSCIRGYVNNGGITPNTVATFTLPADAMPTQYGGPLSKPIDLTVAGLHPFKFYFEHHWWSTNRLNSRNLRMYLIHGLASGVSFEAIKPLITINVNKVKTSFVLTQQNKFDVHLEVADLFPGDDVEISVAGSTVVKDGFNQPLEASSQTYQGQPTSTNVFDLEKNGRETFPSIVFPSSRGDAEDAWALFGRTESPGDQYSSCNMESATYDTFNTNTNLDDVASKFGSLGSYVYPFTDKKQRYAPPKPLTARQGSIIVDIPNTVPSLVNDTATKLAVRVFNPQNRFCDNNAMFIVGSDTVLTSISTPGRLTVYASNLFTAAPVGNVTMKLIYQQRHISQVIPAPLTATSGTNGIATFDITSNLGSRVLVATSPDASVSIAREIYARPVSRKDLGGATTDRGVYNLGNTVYLTGVMRRKENNSPYLIVPPEGTPLNLNVEWTRNNQTTYHATTTKFGTFEASFTVPYNADYTTQSVRISASDGNIATAKFAVADPRVPTAALTLAPVGLDLQLGTADTFDVVASTRTYSGQPIQASNISLSVEIRNVHGNSRYEAQHNLYTVADGTVKKSVPLKGVDGEHATITATWVGPTRELLVKTIKVPIRAALITTSISRTANSGRVIPGVPFDTLVTVDASKENMDVKLASSRFVKISLYPTIAPSTTNQYHRVKDPNAAPVADVSCMLFTNTTTGDYNNLCPISLLSMGVFAAEVVAEDSKGNLATSSILLGELAVSWAMYPLRTPYPVVAKFSTTGAYTRGSNLKVVFNNPYEYTAKALYMCSDSTSALKTVEVPSGSSTVELPPSTCDCPSVGITILTPETNIIIDRKLFPVPISATADFNAPAHFDYNLSPVCTAAPTDIQLTVTPSTTSTTPDSTVDAEISTTAADGATPVEAEVTVIVVDKAMLQLNEPSVFGINEAPTQCMYCWRYNYYNDVDAAAVWYKSESRDGYLSPAYVKTMKQRITALSQANPWLTASNMKEEQYRHMNISLASTLWPPFSLTDFPWFYTPHVPDSYITNYNNGMEEKAEMSDNMANGGMPGAGGSGGGAGGGAMTPGPYPLPAPTAPPRANGDHGGSDKKPSSGIHIRSAYSPTAVTMKVTTDPTTGKANVKLPLNSNVGTWVVRSIAVRASGTKPVATANAEIISRKPLQIVASVPRAVRLGDNFTAGAVASAKVAQSATVSVRMDNCHGLTLRSASSAQSVSLSGAKPLEVLFSFTAVEFDATCSLTFTVTDGTHSDGIAATVPVLAPLAGVSVGTSFVLKDTMQWNEGLAYPSAFPGGRVNITTSVGRLAAIEAMTNNMLKRQSLHYELSGYDLLDRIASFVALHPYANGGNPAVTDDNIKTAQLGATYNASRSAFLEAVHLIQVYSSNTGFHREAAHTRYIDLSLTLSFLHTVRYVLPRSANGNSLEKLYTSAKLATAISQCEAAVIAELNNLAQNWYRLTPSTYYSALFYYTLGSTPASKFTAGKWMNVVIFPWNTLAQMAEDSSSVGLYVQSHAFATMIRDGSYAGYAKVQSDIMDNIRVTGRTAFIAYSGTGYAPSPGSSALLFEGLTLSKTTIEQQLIEKLANFVSQTEGGASANRWYYYRGGDDKIMLALSKYDLAHRVTNPSITLTVKNTSTVLKTIPYIGTESLRHVDLQSYPFTTLSKPAEQSPSGVNSTLNFTSAGTGEASVVVSLNFFPSLPVINKPRYFGLFVEKSSVIMTGKYAGQQVNGSLTPLTPGDLVKVTLAVTTADDVQSIVVTDFTTGGLEPIDAHLSGMSDLLAEANNAAAKTNGVAYGNRRKMQEQSYYPAFYGGWWWMWYFQFMVEVKSDRVVCSGYSPRAGTYECTYFATATTSGDFVVPPAQAVIVSQPEVMGMSTYTFAHVNPKKL